MKFPGLSGLELPVVGFAVLGVASSLCHRKKTPKMLRPHPENTRMRRRALKLGWSTKDGKPKPKGIQFYLLTWAVSLLLLQVYLRVSYLLSSGPTNTPYPKPSNHRIQRALKALDEKLSLDHHAHRAESFSIEIFSAPKPFIGPDREVNLRAIRSWKRLIPTPKITLLGNDLGYEEVAEEYGLHIRRDVDKTFLGVPLFNSMFHIANQSEAAITVIMNGDIVLLQDFVKALKRILTRFEHFLVISARYDLEAVPGEAKEGSEHYERNLRDYVMRHGVLHTYGGMDLWAWNPKGPRLFDGEMPHFIFGRGKYDNWLTHETIAAGRRHVIDASEAIMSIHIRHGYNLVTKSRKTILEHSGGAFWSHGKKSKFELFINIYLSLHTGSYRNQMGTIIFAPWRLARCLETEGSCFVRRLRPGSCNCEYSGSSVATQTDPVMIENSRVIRCGVISQEDRQDYAIPLQLRGDNEPVSFGLPLTLHSVVEKVVINNTIIVTGLNFGYREIMMNWICNLRHLNISNFVVAAFDAELYEFAYTRGISTYLETEVGHNATHADAAYGTASFKQLTKMKSRVVLRFLKLGYNTVWCDTDIILFKNPIENMWGYTADLIIQTNAPDSEEANDVRRINSGFYLAKSNSKVISAFEDVVKFARKSRMSEQPCFYDVICGKSGERKEGNNRCEYKGMKLLLLDRDLYPNGVTKGIWEVERGKILDLFPALFILHNNWVKGMDVKESRFIKHGLVLYDSVLGLCQYPNSF